MRILLSACLLLAVAQPAAAQSLEITPRGASDSLPACAVPAVDTTGWQSAMGFSVGAVIHHPPRYRRRIWERTSDSTKRYVEVQKDGRVTQSRVIVETSESVEATFGKDQPNDRRCMMRTRSGVFPAAIGPRLGRSAGAAHFDTSYAIIIRVRHPRTQRLVVFNSLARDTADFREHLAIAASLRILAIP